LIRVRFHGRGGQGVKTAGRILGTAAFVAGYQCQDSPVYGAERRGAAVVAFTRIGAEPIHERGVIECPDLILVADETLLDDPGAGVLEGQEHASALFVNAAAGGVPPGRHAIRVPLVTDDLTARTIAALGRASALSAGLGGAAARLVGMISASQLEAALHEEFAALGLAPDEIARNVALGREVFDALSAVTFQCRPDEAEDDVVAILYRDPNRGAPTIFEAGNAGLRRTGSWRVERPAIDRGRCTRCGLCFIRCPDAAITLDEQGYPVIDYDHCKGCLICQQVCPVHCISFEKETRAW
jgi:pyruvate ferredoxin oxidoreductase gamma subunit